MVFNEMDEMDEMDDEMVVHQFTISYGINWLEKRRNGRVSLNTRPIPSFQPMPESWSKAFGFRQS